MRLLTVQHFARLFAATLVVLPAMLFSGAGRAADARPPNLEPIPEPPLPAVPTNPNDPTLEPQVTIRQQGEDTVEEFRINGQLYMIRVVPRNGIPFYLTAPPGEGTYPAPVSSGPEVRPPLWVIFSW
jgi:hypothetical protein